MERKKGRYHVKVFNCFVFFSATFFSMICANAQEEAQLKNPRFELSGYIKDLQSTYFIQKADSNLSSNLIHNRLNFKFRFSQGFTLRLEVRNRIIYGEQVKYTPGFGDLIDQSNNVYKLSALLVNEKSFVVHSVIDRLLLRYTRNKWDINLGRQRINWGINTLWNPNDLFNAYNFLDFDYEERPGTDAIRIQRYFPKNASLDIAYKPGKRKDDHIMGLLFRFNKWKYDVQLLTGLYRSDVLLGGGWAGIIKQLGFKGEISHFIPVIEPKGKQQATTFSTMIERTFKHDWYASIGFLYLSDPVNMLFVGPNIYASNVSVKQLFPFQYTFSTSIMKSLTPLISANLTTSYSTENNTLIVFPSLNWNVASNVDLSLTAQLFFAEQEAAYTNRINGFFFRTKWCF